MSGCKRETLSCWACRAAPLSCSCASLSHWLHLSPPPPRSGCLGTTEGAAGSPPGAPSWGTQHPGHRLNCWVELCPWASYACGWRRRRSAASLCYTDPSLTPTSPAETNQKQHCQNKSYEYKNSKDKRNEGFVWYMRKWGGHYLWFGGVTTCWICFKKKSIISTNLLTFWLAKNSQQEKKREKAD